MLKPTSKRTPKTNPLREISLAGSKSISNRALLLCKINKILGLKVPVLKNLSTSSDTLIMKEGLKMLTQKTQKIPKIINLGDTGTAVRFLTAFAAITGKEVTITGSKRMKKRPIQDLADALNHLGCKVKTTNGCPPVTILKSEFKGGKTIVKGNISSQFLSALLMVAPLATKFSKTKTKTKVKIEVRGKLTSLPYIEMTKNLIKIFQKEPKEFFIEGDASSASYLHLYSQLTDKKIQIKNLSKNPKNSIQGDSIYPKLKPIGTIDMSETPDLVMPFSILSSFTKGKTRITNISNLRIKESNRIKALEKELKKLGIKVKTGKDFIEIQGEEKGKIIQRNLKKHIKIETYGDHRIVMAFGVLKKTILPKLKIKNPSVVRKSYPEFWSDMNELNR